MLGEKFNQTYREQDLTELLFHLWINTWTPYHLVHVIQSGEEGRVYVHMILILFDLAIETHFIYANLEL